MSSGRPSRPIGTVLAPRAAPASSPMAYSALPRIEGIAMGVNYGFDRVRFLHPVRAGSRVRARFTLMAVTQRSPREWQLTYDVSVEIEGQHKPALAATWLTMQVTGA